MRYINFSKFSGQGNDFIIIDATKEEIKLSRTLISKMCDRHFGIGADGLIFVRNSRVADFYMDYYNQDGSTAEMCGNGIRCMADLILKKKLTNKPKIEIETLAGIKIVEAGLNSKTSAVQNIKVNMGSPVFEPGKIPVDITKDTGFITKKSNINTTKNSNFVNSRINIKNDKIINYPVLIKGNKFKINCLSMGNPHCVIFLDKNFNLEKIPVCSWGPVIENHPIFPRKTNVEFVRVEDKNKITIRVWERGVGETMACGTGACAASVCSIELGKVKESKVKVNLSGGFLKVYWEGKNFPVYLEGRVLHIFDGCYFF